MRQRYIILVIAFIMTGLVNQTTLQAQVLGRGFGGALGGAALGSLVGGRDGAQTGAIIGGVVGLAQGAKEKKQREAYARQQAERQRIQQAQQQAEMEHRQKQEAKVEQMDAATVLEIQKSLVRIGYDPGDINGKMQPSTENAIRLYEQKYGLLETGRPSQELLKHMLKNGG